MIEEEKKKQEFLERMEGTFYHIRSFLKMLEENIHSEEIEIQVLAAIVISKVIIVFEELMDEVYKIKDEISKLDKPN